MDAFEQLVAELFFAEGFWVQTSLKVMLTKEEKRLIGRHSSPRWEIDVVAYKAATNEIVALECKSFLDSTGVQCDEFQDGHSSTRYKLFREPVLRETVLRRLALQMAGEGRCQPDPVVKLGLVAAKVKRGDGDRLVEHFADRDWLLFGPSWLRERLRDMASGGYTNQVSSVVAKLLLRPPDPDLCAEKAVQQGNVRVGQFPPDARIVLLVNENPKRPGSQAWERFQGYFEPSASTVAGARAAGVRTDDLRYDLERGYIRLG